MFGDLPDDVKVERTENQPDDLYQPVTADYSRQAPAPDVHSPSYPGMTGLNVPKFGTTVQSTYDTRPVNGTDFIFGDRDTLTDTCQPSLSLTLFDYSVPSGYIGVLRDITLTNFVGAYTSGPFVDPMTMTLKVNGISQLGMTDVVVLQMDFRYDFHVVADERSVVSLHLNLGSPHDTGITIGVFGLLHGQLLLKRGFPVPFEIGSD